MPTTATYPEARIVLRRVRWETYEALLADRGEDGPKMVYDRGTLEIMAPSRKHEKIKKLIARFIEIFALERRLRIDSGGSTTLKIQFRERGLEPLESYYVQNEGAVRHKDDIDLAVDPPPDLAVEVDITASSVDKLGVYAALGVPEVWSYDQSGVRVYLRGPGREYAVSDVSAAFPDLSIQALNRFVARRCTLDETHLVLEFQAWVRGEAPRA